MWTEHTNSLNPFVDKYLSVFISAHRKAHSANDVLIRFIENWKQSLDNHKYVGICKTDFSFNKCCTTINVSDFFPVKSCNLRIQVRIDKTTINLQLQVSCFCDHYVNKCFLLQKYSFVKIWKFFNWFADIKEYKYFLQSLLLNVCSRNKFSCWNFKTNYNPLLKSSLWFGYISIANFSWRHKEHHFVMFAYGAAVQIISHTNVGVSFFCFLYFRNITGESCTVRIVLISKWLEIEMFRNEWFLCFLNSPSARPKMHFFGLDWC